MIPPNIKPTNGTKTTLRCRILRTIARKIKLAANVKRKASSIFTNDPEDGTKIRKMSSPIFAASNVPAVVGATNLFCVICCMITPEILMPTPASISAAVRGMRLIMIKSSLSAFQWMISVMETSATPTKRDISDAVIRTNVRTRVFK